MSRIGTPLVLDVNRETTVLVLGLRWQLMERCRVT